MVTHVFGTSMIEELDQVFSGNDTTVMSDKRGVRWTKRGQQVDGRLTNACGRMQQVSS